MLSYMLPVEEKPPPIPPKGHLQLTLSSATHQQPIVSNGKAHATPISKETSVSSFVSDTTATASHSSMTPTSTSTDKGKPRLAINGGKHQTLKRVSFGSSKGSMVETLIFESPLQEGPEPSPIPENGGSFPAGCDSTEDEREKVRVTFFQQSKPLEVDLPDDQTFNHADFVMSSPVLKNDVNHVAYNRTESTESGWDNPFRPGGDLSREADQIVELIKGGKPITPTPGSQPHELPSVDDSPNCNNGPVDRVDALSPKKANELGATPLSKGGGAKVNGSAKDPAPGQLDVQRGTIKPEGDGAQVEHVMIKKKPKCQCCVIQ
ncbi:uncharacterized protein LOC132707903 [Cylas formicarius]|uniref:uncharacterized protein LOC132707903 n=1 Tax=Cylas formicarius TaxID=197179 RepID=UPI002958DE3B|nr:uncharacterized protein LOC132707903 [Cylas formicarius]